MLDRPSRIDERHIATAPIVGMVPDDPYGSVPKWQDLVCRITTRCLIQFQTHFQEKRSSYPNYSVLPHCFAYYINNHLNVF